MKAILPAGLWYQIREVWHVAEGMDRCAATGIRRAAPVLDALFAAGGSAELSVLEEACGKEAGTVLRALQKAGVTVCETAARRRIGDKSRRMVELAVSAEEAASLTEKRSSPQRREAVRLRADERGGGMLLHRRLHGRPPGDGEGGDRGFFSGRGAAAAGPDGGGTQRSYRPQ